MSVQLTPQATSPLLTMLADLVHDDYGAAELSLVRKQLALGTGRESVVGEVGRFLDALAVVQKRPTRDCYVWAGRRLAAPVSKSRPAWLRDHTSVRTILLQFGRVAPAVVANLVGEGACPEFWEDFLDGETVQIGFDGPEEVAWVIEGAVGGLSEFFGERAELSRGVPAASLLERRLVNVKVIPERRAPQRGARPVVGLSSPGLRS
jgi:hypothetical protein